MENVIVAPQIRDLTVLAGQLSLWLAEKLPAARDVRLENLSYPFGAGMSHETILFDASWTAEGERSEQGFVVRIKPQGHTVFPDDLFDQQHRTMRALHEDGRVKVAQVYWMEQDPELLGAPFFVMEKLRGRVAVTMPPYAESGWVAEATPAQRHKFWENGVRQLAAIHTVPLDGFAFLKDENGLQGLEQEWDKWARYLEWISRDRRQELLDVAHRKLRAAWPKNQPPGIVWGDARIGNIMFDDDFEAVAVMDWEQPSLGGGLNDLAWWLHHSQIMHGATPERPHLEGMGTRDETIALWSHITGFSTDDMEWYDGFTAFKFACMGTRMAELRGWPAPTGETLRTRLEPALKF